jgi:hypothetical protein
MRLKTSVVKCEKKYESIRNLSAKADLQTDLLQLKDSHFSIQNKMESTPTISFHHRHKRQLLYTILTH